MEKVILWAALAAVLVGCERQDPGAVAKGKPAASAVAVVDESRMVEKLESAVEGEDFNAALACVKVLGGSTNAEVRLRCVESIGWFGGKAVRVLLPFLLDRNEDIRSAAQDQWDSAVNDIEDEQEKGMLVEEAMMQVRDREVMDSLSFQLNDLPPTLSIDIIVHLIAGSNGVARLAAKEAYEFVTGDEWRGPKAAQKWLEENQEDEDDE